MNTYMNNLNTFDVTNGLTNVVDSLNLSTTFYTYDIDKMQQTERQGEVLKKLIRAAEMTQESFAKEFGVARTYLQVLFDKKSLNEKQIEKACKVLGVSQSAFEVGYINIAAEPSASYSSVMRVPFVPAFSFENYITNHSNNDFLNGLPVMPFSVEYKHQGRYVSFQVPNDEMNDGTNEAYLHNDVILCRNIDQSLWINKLHINKWDFVIVHKTEGVMIRRIIDHNTETGSIKVHCLNPFYPDQELNLKDVMQLLNVVRVERKK